MTGNFTGPLSAALNWGFERDGNQDGIPDAWTKTTSAHEVSLVSDNVHGGQKAVRIVTERTYLQYQITQYVPVTAQTSYTLTYWVWCESGGWGCGFRSGDLARDLGYLTDSGATGGWVQRQVPLNTGSETRVFLFFCNNYPGEGSALSGWMM